MKKIRAVAWAVILLFLLGTISGCDVAAKILSDVFTEQGVEPSKKDSKAHSVLGNGNQVLRIVSGSENRELEPLLESYALENHLRIEMTYMGSVDIMRRLQEENSEFDAVWPASSIWISMGDTSFRVKHSKSTTITPVVFGVRKSLAEELGWIGKDVSINDIIEAIQTGKLKFCMTSATQSNSGASAYLGFLSGLTGSPEVLTREHLQAPDLQMKISELLAGVERSSGSSEWLKTLFLSGDFDAMVNYESLIITTNEEREKQNKEPLYVIYPYDGLAIADSPLGYLDQGDATKEETFLAFQEFLASQEAQDAMQKLGRRTGYTGVFESNQSVFREEWGVDTKRILSPLPTPTAEVLQEALQLYQTNFRKPSLSIYCLDFSGSMSGTGERQLKEAMDLIFDQKKAAEVLLQASEKERNYIFIFNSAVIDSFFAEDGREESLAQLNERIKEQEANGGTDMYYALEEALSTLDGVDLSAYTPAIILLTDGRSGGDFESFRGIYDAYGYDIPIFSILFGDADREQLEQLAEYTKARVFDGREDLVNAFRSVKGYN